MHVIAYTSELKSDAGNPDDVIADIINTSKENNAENDITGALFFHDGRFLQVIEGEEDALRNLMKKIDSDARHQEVRYLMDTQEKERSFSHWKMDEIQLGKGKEFDAKHLEAITKSFEKFMVPSCDMLVHFYKTLLAERKRVLGIF